MDTAEAEQIAREAASRPLPSYSTRRDYLDVISEALDEASRHPNPEESAYYVHRLPPHLTQDIQKLYDTVMLNQPELMGVPMGHLRGQLQLAYFVAISRGDSQVVAKLIESRLVDANTPSYFRSLAGPHRILPFLSEIPGHTPLLAAVLAKNTRMVMELVDFGADVNGWGVEANYPRGRHASSKARIRTPLQVAASLRNLPLVKLFHETYHADDTLIAPDGQTALRLAANAGDAEIVSYLPACRGGSMARLGFRLGIMKTKIARTLSNVKYVLKFIFWEIPKFIYRETVLQVWRLMRKDWRAALVRITKRIARLSQEVVHELWRELKHLPRRMTRTILSIPRACWSLLKTSFKLLSDIWDQLQNLVLRIVSFLHTFVVSIIPFLTNLTLRDVIDGFKDLLNTIFITFPRNLWRGFSSFFSRLGRLIEYVFGGPGHVFVLVIFLSWEAVSYILKKTSRAVGAVLGLFKHGIDELLVWWNPKYLHPRS